MSDKKWSYILFIFYLFYFLDQASFGLDVNSNLQGIFYQLNTNSLLNPGNTLQIPNKVILLKSNVSHTGSVFKNFSYSIDLDNQLSLDTLGCLPYRIVESKTYINRFLVEYFLNEQLEIKFGKEDISFGNSLNDRILSLYKQRDAFYRNDRYWYIAAKGYLNTLFYSLQYIPPLALDVDSELKNINKFPIYQIRTELFVAGIDAAVLTQLNEDSSFVALALSYSMESLPHLVMYSDMKLINIRSRYGIQNNNGSYDLNETKRVKHLLSPLLVGINWMVLNNVDLKWEYLYNKYAFSKNENELLFNGLETDPPFFYEFAAIDYNNIFSQHYLSMIVHIHQFIVDSLTALVYVKVNMTDYSALFSGQISYKLGGNMVFELGVVKALYQETKSEYGSFLNEESIFGGIKIFFL